VLIFVEPRVQVNPVIDDAPTDPNRRDALLLEERNANAQILRRLPLGKAADRWQRERRFIHVLVAVSGRSGPRPLP
jgi:hypothetical protein